MPVYSEMGYNVLFVRSQAPAIHSLHFSNTRKSLWWKADHGIVETNGDMFAVLRSPTRSSVAAPPLLGPTFSSLRSGHHSAGVAKYNL